MAACGGWKDNDLNSDEIVKAAEIGLAFINKMSNSAFPLKLKRVVDAKSQLVAGMNFEIVLEVELDSGRTEKHKVRVYRNLKQVMEVTKHEIL